MSDFNSEFRKLKYHFKKHGIFIINESFKDEIFGYLEENRHQDWKTFDRFFNRFNPFWTEKAQDNQNLKLRDYRRIKHFFDNLLKVVNEWEKKYNSYIHKGTPYYYYGMASIVNGDLEKGFSLMHQAAEEDRRYKRQETPAHYFILLNSTQLEQLFYPKVYHITYFLELLIDQYQRTHSMSLNINEIRNKFLSKSDYIEESYLFIYCIFKFNWFIDEINKNYRKNPYASYIESSLIFDLCKICESVLKKLYEIREPDVGRWTLPMLLGRLCDTTGLGLNQNDFDQGLRDDICNYSFHTIVNLLIKEVYTFKHLANPNNKIDYNLGLTYVLRNFGGHYIKEMDIIYENFEDIFKRVLFTFFYIIEMEL